MSDTCVNCNAFLQLDDEKGVCRARPPMPVVVGVRPPMVQGQPGIPLFQSIFPTMSVDAWCREHQAKVDFHKIDLTQLGSLTAEGSA
jgi:hypothetical protein